MKFSMLPALSALVFFSFSKNGGEFLKKNKTQVETVVENKVASTSSTSSDLFFTVDTLKSSFPVLQKDYQGFKAAVGFKESQGSYKRVNSFGYMGKYQFGKHTLALIGVHDVSDFLNDAKLQEEAFYAYTSRNKWVLRREIKQFSGKTVAGVKVTESGILAAAHLAGPGGVKRFLHSNGTHHFADAFGTTIAYYMTKFGGYDVSSVEADHYAKVDLKREEDKQQNA